MFSIIYYSFLRLVFRHCYHLRDNLTFIITIIHNINSIIQPDGTGHKEHLQPIDFVLLSVVFLGIVLGVYSILRCMCRKVGLFCVDCCVLNGTGHFCTILLLPLNFF